MLKLLKRSIIAALALTAIIAFLGRNSPSSGPAVRPPEPPAPRPAPINQGDLVEIVFDAGEAVRLPRKGSMQEMEKALEDPLGRRIQLMENLGLVARAEPGTRFRAVEPGNVNFINCEIVPRDDVEATRFDGVWSIRTNYLRLVPSSRGPQASPPESHSQSPHPTHPEGSQAAQGSGR